MKTFDSSYKEINRPLLILDLDETLIFATTEEKDFKCNFMVFEYFVHLRPYLKQFLENARVRYDIAIWSAGTPDYVNNIAKEIMPPDLIPIFIWSRDRCTLRRDFDTDELFYRKDLKKATTKGYPLSKMLIVEDSRRNVQSFYGNAIYIKPFTGEDQDTELKLLSIYLEKLSNCTDFRSVEKRNWRAETLQL